MGRSVVALGLCTMMLCLVALPSMQAHEQKTLSVILLDDGAVYGNISDPSFVQGNAMWFKMEDGTGNATMVARLDVNQDGVFNASVDFESGVMMESCELDENGSLVDEECIVSSTYAFPSNASTGMYTYWILRDHNTTVTMWNYTIYVHEDIHEEDGPSPGDCFGAGCETGAAEDEDVNSGVPTDEAILQILALLAFIAIIFLSISIRKDRLSGKSLDSVHASEDE